MSTHNFILHIDIEVGYITDGTAVKLYANIIDFGYNEFQGASENISLQLKFVTSEINR